MNMVDQFVSIIIPVLNQAEKLDKCLLSLSNQLKGMNNIEVLVVDNGSNDGSELIAKKYNFKSIQYLDVRNPYQARNKAAVISSGEVLVFLDAKCIPNENYIAEIQKMCKVSDWDLVAGDFDFIELSSKSSLSELAYAVVYLKTNPKYNGGEVSTLTGNMMVKKEAFFDLGRFDTRRSGGDVRFSQKAERLNKLKIYNPKLRVSYAAKKYKDLIQSTKRDAGDLPSKVSWRSIRPAGKKYIDERLQDLKINIDGFKKLRLMFFIMYLRFIKYYHQAK